MKILLTGASSFTGCWFASALAESGHDVTATFTPPALNGYTDPLRRRRVEQVLGVARPLWGSRFGDDAFLGAVRADGYDVLCCHGADVTDYKSEAFDYAAALAANTRNLPRVLESAVGAGGASVVLTGSVFEGGEGSGGQGLPHFSPYGLSKALTAEAFRYCCGAAGLPLGKFVIPNPFGPLEEPRFTSYLIRTWRAGDTPCVRTPDYVRDNIPVRLLARCYAGFVESVGGQAFERYGPSGYIETQGAFADRFGREMGSRLGLDARVEHARQTEFPEPRIRVNADAPDRFAPDWDAQAAWDEMADYYREP